MRTLYQFDLSHFCEKARWALDHKGLDYTVVNLVPGPHRRTVARLAPTTSVPLLVDGDDVIQGSGEIISWLDRRYPGNKLTPVGDHDAALALDWERRADEHIGVPLRLFFYRYVLEDRALATALLTDHGPWWGRPLYAVAFPFVRRAMRQAMDITPVNAERAAERLVRSFEELEDRLAGRSYLAGAIFSRADLAVSALLAPAFKASPGLPAALDRFIETHRERPAMVWAQDVYARHRQRS
ncbi:MAG: glutathione S-transferase family protein [Gammaproteobacteria bacterium]